MLMASPGAGEPVPHHCQVTPSHRGVCPDVLTFGFVPFFFFHPSQLSGFYCKTPNFPLHFLVCNNISNPPLLGDS